MLWKFVITVLVLMAMSGSLRLLGLTAGFFGMKTATQANIRTASAARKGLNEALQVAFKGGSVMGLSVAGLALLGLGAVAPESFMAHFTVFVLACFVGYMVIWNVTAALHTPLMSVTNAISSIIVIGALIQVSSDTPLIKWIAVGTVLITSINIFGGFAVTRRMLEMFRK